MLGLKSFLEEEQNIIVHHNADDVILNDGDIDFIKETFQDRAFIFPRGGHMGNVWWEDNVKLFLHNLLSP